MWWTSSSMPRLPLGDIFYSPCAGLLDVCVSSCVERFRSDLWSHVWTASYCPYWQYFQAWCSPFPILELVLGTPFLNSFMIAPFGLLSRLLPFGRDFWLPSSGFNMKWQPSWVPRTRPWHYASEQLHWLLSLGAVTVVTKHSRLQTTRRGARVVKESTLGQCL
jgi:hypothetical protein